MIAVKFWIFVSFVVMIFMGSRRYYLNQKKAKIVRDIRKDVLSNSIDSFSLVLALLLMMSNQISVRFVSILLILLVLAIHNVILRLVTNEASRLKKVFLEKQVKALKLSRKRRSDLEF